MVMKYVLLVLLSLGFCVQLHAGSAASAQSLKYLSKKRYDANYMYEYETSKQKISYYELDNDPQNRTRFLLNRMEFVLRNFREKEMRKPLLDALDDLLDNKPNRLTGER